MSVFLRLLKVFYVLFLLFGLLIGWFMWMINTPNVYTTYSYKVICNNGKEFDPTSKPIDSTYDVPKRFAVNQLKSECEYGTAYYVGLANNITDNFELYKTPHENKVGSQSNQINQTLIAVAIYYFVLEVIRRTFLYIFFGKNFITLKNSKAKK